MLYRIPFLGSKSLHHLEPQAPLKGANKKRALAKSLDPHMTLNSKPPEDMPDDAEGLLSGFITFGAELEGDAGPLTSMDEYFVTHWWTMVESTLPAGRSVGADAASSSATNGTVGGGQHGEATMAATAQGQRKREWAPADAPDLIDLNDSYTLPAGHQSGLAEDEDKVNVAPQDPLHTETAVQEPPHTMAASGPGESAWDVNPACVRAMEEEFEKHKSQQLRAFERQVMAEAMERTTPEDGIRVELRGGVRNARRRSTTQTMCFRIRPGEEIEVKFLAP